MSKLPKRSRLKELVRSVASTSGLEIINLGEARNYLLRHHLAYLFKMYDIGAVIDIGANIGGYGDFLIHECGFHGEIFSCEPVSDTFQSLLEASAPYANWHAFNTAIAAKSGTKKINVLRGSVLTSFLEPIGVSPDMEKVGEEDVKTETLDFITEMIISQNISLPKVLLKLDTQGYDRTIFHGNIDQIRLFGLLSLEMSSRQNYAASSRMGDFLNDVLEEDFSLSGIFSVSRDQKMRVADFDCVFINNRLLIPARSDQVR